MSDTQKMTPFDIEMLTVTRRTWRRVVQAPNQTEARRIVYDREILPEDAAADGWTEDALRRNDVQMVTRVRREGSDDNL